MRWIVAFKLIGSWSIAKRPRPPLNFSSFLIEQWSGWGLGSTTTGYDTKRANGHQFFFLVGYVEERLWGPIQSPDKRKKEESKQLRGERDKIRFINLSFERWQVVGLRKARRMRNTLRCNNIALSTSASYLILSGVISSSSSSVFPRSFGINFSQGRLCIPLGFFVCLRLPSSSFSLHLVDPHPA